jgi:RNA recognition motif-containing protein
VTLKRLYVGNLPITTTVEEVRAAFSRYGAVASVSLAESIRSNRPGSFGYVEMEDGGEAAIAGLNRTDLGGQPLTVCSAQPRKEALPPAPPAIRRTGPDSQVG